MAATALGGDASANTSLISFPLTMGPIRSTSPRPPSPSNFFLRPADASGYVAGSNTGASSNPGTSMSFGDRVRTLSSPSLRRSSVSGGPSLGDGESNLWYNDADPFASNHLTKHALGSITSPPMSTVTLPSADGLGKQHTPKPQRGSILIAASDALHFGRGLGSAFSWRKSKPSTTSSEHHHSSLLHTSLWNGKSKSKGKGKWALQPPASPISTTFLPDVIEISAANSEKPTSALHSNGADDEEAERGRLREAAAQSIGIAPLMRDSIASSNGIDRSEFSAELSENQLEHPSDTDSVRDANKSQTAVSQSINTDYPDVQVNGNSEISTTSPISSNAVRSRRNPSISVKTTPSVRGTQNAGLGENGAILVNEGSLVDTLKSFSIPAFPCVKSALAPDTQMASNVSKHYLSSSFLAFGLGRQWRSRYIIFTGPSQSRISASFLSSRSCSSTPTYHLHLFKSMAADERELERLQINEDSIVFVADADVAGRRSVVKVGGVDVGVQRKELNAEIDGRTIWLLHLPDLGDPQKWITAIKDAILLQRAEKSGLRHIMIEPKATEPRGDMDVMLSMRAQNLTSTAAHKVVKSSYPNNTESRPSYSADDHAENNNNRLKSSSPSPTVRSWTSDNRPTSAAVTTLKGLFAATGRPRSPSRASSVLSKDRDHEDSVSFSSRGNTLLNLLRSNGTVTTESETPVALRHTDSSNATSASVDTLQAFSVSSLSKVQATLDQPIVKDLNSVDLSNVDVSGSKSSSQLWYNSQQSLPPPPRSRRPWTSSGVPGSTIDSRGFVTRPGRASFQGSSTTSVIRVSYEGGSGSSRDRHTPDSALVNTVGTDIHDFKMKRTSVSSTVSSLASGFYDRDPLSPNLGATPKRRSRMGKLPQMLTPPSGPPPSAPQQESSVGLSLHPYAAENSMSQNSTKPSGSTEVADESYTTSKRFSASSAISSSSMSTTQSRVNKFRLSRNFSATSNSLPSKRASMPPPRPVPTFAIPPTPTTEAPQAGAEFPRRLSFRDSLVQRPFKASAALNAFPRKSQDSDRQRRPSTSTGIISINHASANSRPFGPRAPPPTGPLPPPPRPSSPTGQRTSIKHRLRLKSAPTPSPNHSPSTKSQEASKTLQSDISNLDDSDFRSSVILGEPITTKQNDLDFLDSITTSHTLSSTSIGNSNYMHTVSQTSIPVSISISSAISQNDHILYPAGSSPDTLELKSLTPPPRRGVRPHGTHTHSHSVRKVENSIPDKYERTPS